MKTYDAIVIGAGAMGSAASYYLARNGQKTLLLEQFHLDHDRGSSHDDSRIIRYSYDHPAYIGLSKGAYPLWHELEAESGENLLIQTGGLDFGYPDYPHFANTRQSLLDTNVPFEYLTPDEVCYRFPQFQLDEGMMAIYQPDAGMLRPSRIVVTHTRLAQQYGAEFIEQAKVLDIQPSTQNVIVKTAQGDFQAARLVITAGSWARQVLEQVGLRLPLQPTREMVCFFKGTPPELFSVEQCPIYINWGETSYYGIGSVDGSGFKAAQHGRHEPVSPDTMKRTVDPEYVEQVRGFLRRHIPNANGELVNSRMCLYTMTPDEHFVIDQHPEYPHIVFGAGFSGHGFKFSTLIGQILYKLATGQPVEYDISLFDCTRF